MSTYSITFGKELCRAIGAPFTSQNDLFLRAWAQSENSRATFNPYATTKPWPGATRFNSVGVRNYATWQDGVAATAATLLNGLYDPIVANLRNGSSALSTARALAASRWGTGDLTIEVLTYGGPRAFPYGNCYPIPPARYDTKRGTTKIRPGSAGRDVDELLRCIARKRGVDGYKWYSGDVVEWVKRWQAARPSLGTPDGVVGPLTYASICGHP
jgi:hypothetical protein